MFSGGGTGGSVTPLLAVAEELLKETAPDMSWELFFVGSKKGPEKELVASFNQALGANIKPFTFIALTSGKWRRYFSLRNFLDIFKCLVGFFESLRILRKVKPELIISAGSFVSVPLVWAASLKKIPILIHQQDVRPGLANKLMAPFARAVTVTFESSLIDYGPKAVWTGNPVKELNVKPYVLENKNKPLVIAIGGGTGATALNELIFPEIENYDSFCKLIHLTGQGKSSALKNRSATAYQAFEFLPHDEVLSLMAAADLVISRCGLGTLSELSFLGKPAVLIPIPHSHQEDNAALWEKQQAALVLNQTELTPDKLASAVKDLLADEAKRETLGAKMAKVMKPGAAEKIAALIWEMINFAS